jgi:hypothetical protein
MSTMRLQDSFTQTHHVEPCQSETGADGEMWPSSPSLSTLSSSSSLVSPSSKNHFSLLGWASARGVFRHTASCLSSAQQQIIHTDHRQLRHSMPLNTTSTSTRTAFIRATSTEVHRLRRGKRHGDDYGKVRFPCPSKDDSLCSLDCC